MGFRCSQWRLGPGRWFAGQGKDWPWGLGKNPMDDDSTFTHLSGDATGYEGYDHDASHVQVALRNHDHNVYFEEGTETLQDIGRVVAGVKE